jgi:alkaline phosphatase
MDCRRRGAAGRCAGRRPTATQASDGSGASGRHETGNMIFIHPDGSDAAMWELARIYWYGPDAVSNWDQLDVAVPYRGHASDILTTSSNGGATTHAFGFKTDAPDSFGTDSGAEDVLAGDAEEPRAINALSGYAGSWLREAGNAGLPIGVVNDGDVAEPGTAAFLTEVTERSDASALEIARQLIQGRPGFDDADADPAVVMGGGEDLFFPADTPVCAQDVIDAALADTGAPVATIPLDCVVHRAPGDTLDDDGPSATGGLRSDGLNLAQAAADEGYLVIRTRAEFEALGEAIESGDVDPAETKVLALFASQDVFNAVAEEQLIDAGLVDASVPADAKETNLVLYGSEPGTPGYQPPTAPEMAAVATTILEAHSEAAGKPFATVWEVEGTDNMSNIDNAPGTLLEARYADEVIGVARDFLEQDPSTTILTAADGRPAASRPRRTTSTRRFPPPSSPSTSTPARNAHRRRGARRPAEPAGRPLRPRHRAVPGRARPVRPAAALRGGVDQHRGPDRRGRHPGRGPARRHGRRRALRPLRQRRRLPGRLPDPVRGGAGLPRGGGRTVPPRRLAGHRPGRAVVRGGRRGRHPRLTPPRRP